MVLTFPSSPSSGPPRSVATRSDPNSPTSETGSRVYVRQAAIDASLKHTQSRFLGRKTNTNAKGSVLHHNDSFSHSETESCTDASSVVMMPGSSSRQFVSWEWKEAVLLENHQGRLTVRLTSNNATIDLPSTVWQENQVVTANDVNTEPGGVPQYPSDLITLTHLHEPAVVESLQHRFGAEQIYTNTGPVLLALNPFQTLRGLYGETIQKKYWERAESMMSTTSSSKSSSPEDLPPHVYAIADASFRNMMRKQEDHLNDRVVPPSDGGTTALSGCNQSILVSGESGAGKTVTTKFVMKYLAALSQRCAVRQNEKRAYLQAAENTKPAVQRMSPSKTKAFGDTSKLSSPWSKNNKKQALLLRSSSSTNSNNGNNNNNDLAHVTTCLSGDTNSNSIEAQVLQSNPILESFGNARTVRNDNSSRFGKFIEIQFTATGKLVGAKIDTYLLEKVRLLRQSYEERNYHIFYELLSGHVSPSELSHYFLAKTATPHDFKLTCQSGTYDRRDGVSDGETYEHLRTAMTTMQFDNATVRDIFGVTAAILHASNLTFVGNSPSESSSLEPLNVHLQPVCQLLGVNPKDLNEALCAFTIQAGKENMVRRSLSVVQAEKGLEALLKTVYGALFTYLVQRINESIAFDKMDAAAARPVASIGVLDIFGFESFQQNSFEQLCINYCNEALQQQFNAFVLKNEQAEYEAEGIEWSFIEFPENQDVLDLIEKRGTGILSVLDDQCRAPGPSDKAFAINLYNTCGKLPRFFASRKQTATLQFSVQHYAGPVEYSSSGFVEKNRDELSREATELLKMSRVPFVQELAYIIETSREESSSGAPGATVRPKKLHRADSSVGRATVGGQFRRQLRDLRQKIDLTTPHYIRCIKPNDLLVPELFDAAIVADQLKCGGILEAIRVARAGFTQHYPHADFVRRYRVLAWKELANSKKNSASISSSSNSVSTSSWKKAPARPASYRAPPAKNVSKKVEKTAAEFTSECKELVSIIYRKLRRQDSSSEDGDVPSTPPPPVKAKQYSFQASPGPSWSKTMPLSPSRCLPPMPGTNGRKAPPPLKLPMDPPKREAPSTPKSSSNWKRGAVTSGDYLKIGIQMGKTKVFLRHKCFEILERLRSHEQTRAATKLNSRFRTYLARIAYLPFRNAFRQEVRERRLMFESGYDEKKESDMTNDSAGAHSFRYNPFRKGPDFGKDSLVDKWMESQIRDAIHNPVPRHEWGKQAPGNLQFRWILNEGLWVKNYSHFEN